MSERSVACPLNSILKSGGEQVLTSGYDLAIPHTAQLRTLKTSAELLGELLERAGRLADEVPEDLWREIAHRPDMAILNEEIEALSVLHRVCTDRLVLAGHRVS